MKYFLDTEFLEKPNTIDLISIGIVDENGREYYALNKEANLKSIWKDDWLRENVLMSIYTDYIHGDMRNRFRFTYRTVKMIFREAGQTKEEIRRGVISFMNYLNDKPIDFYGYYSDYDWVVFCWIWGRMVDLPDGMPMYCKDLKQIMDEKGLDDEWKKLNCSDPKEEHNALIDARWNMKLYNEIFLQSCVNTK